MTGAELQAARTSLGLTQRQLADLWGYSSTTGHLQVAKIENGRFPVPKAKAVEVQRWLAGERPANWPTHRPSERRPSFRTR